MSKSIAIESKHKIRFLIAGLFPVIGFTFASAAYAACTNGSAPATDSNTVTCAEGSSFNNPFGTTITNTATVVIPGSTSVVTIDGNGNKFINAGTLSNASIYSAATASGTSYGLFIGANTGTNEEAINSIKNTGTISSIVNDTNVTSNAARVNTRAVVGVGTDVEGIYSLNNSGTISASHFGVGRVNAVEAGGDVEEMVIENSGTISGLRGNTITITANTATSLQGTVTTSGALTTTAATIGVAAGIYSEEEGQSLIINNRKNGVIESTGTLSSAIYTRVVETNILNEGIIRNNSNSIAVAAVSDSGETRSIKLENTSTGQITGDMLMVNGAALRWLSLSLDPTKINLRLNINSQVGQLDSQIENAGSISGNLYYSNGTHELINTGIISGNIDLDQRAITTSGGIEGTRDFKFENSGNYSGNITVRTVPTSNISFLPTITGSGLNSSIDAPSNNISGLGGNLKVFDGSPATDGSNSTADLAKVSPIAGSAVQAGQWFKLSDNLYGTILPTILNESALVTWALDRNAAGNLIVGVDSVASLSSIGVTGRDAASLNALLSYNGTDQAVNEAAGKVLNFSSADDIKKAGAQLRPEVNGASVQAIQSLTDRVYGLVGVHLGETHLAKASGNSGVASGDAANSSGVWFQGFGGRGDQGRRSGVDGYDIDAYGFAAGADTLVANSNLRVGAALSYGQSNIDDKGARTGNRTDINSYQGLAYASWLFDQWYLNAALGLGQHKFDDKKLVLGNKITGSHDAWQYSAKIDAGYPIQLGSARLIPVASMTYSHLNQDSYTENGSGAQKISADNTDSLRSGLGLKALFPLYEGGVNASLELRTIWNHELADRSQDMTARFVGGGSAYTVKGLDLPRDSANLGASLRVSSVGQSLQQSLLLSYDAEVKSQFTSHTARLQARFDF